MTKIPRRNLWICLCLVAVIAAVYAPVRRFHFVDYDDDDYVVENAHVHGGLTLPGVAWAFTTNHADNWHPLTWLSHMLDWQLWGGDAGAHHLVNVLFHMANTVLLFGFLCRVTASPWRSALVAGVFALHPQHVESVAWVSERKDVLSTCCWMVAMWAYARYVEQPDIRRYLSTLGLFALGLMAKPMMVTLPFVFLLLDYWPLGRTRWAEPATGTNAKATPGQLLREKIPFFALAAACCAVTYWAQHAGGAVVSLVKLSWGRRISDALLSYVAYIGKAFWPTGLAAFYPLRLVLSVVSVAAAGAGLVGVTALVLRKSPRAPWLVTGWFWYLGTLVPVIGLVQIGVQSMADRYTYIPMIGLLLMLCWSIPARVVEWRMGRMMTGFMAGTVLVVCAVLSSIQVGYWKDSETLFRHALAVTRNNWLAHYNLAVALAREGRHEEAIGHYEQSLHFSPNNPSALSSLGGSLARVGRVQEAIEDWKQALRLDPNLAEAHYNLGVALAGLGRKPEAVEQWEQALRINPDYAQAHYNLGVALEQAGDVNGAIQHYERALECKPDYALAEQKLERLRAVR